MKRSLKVFHFISNSVYTIASVFLLFISLTMIGYSLWEVGHAFGEGGNLIYKLLDGIGIIIIAVAVFDVSKYLMEEEVLRHRELRSLREARQTLTKFFTIIGIAVSLEALVFIFAAGKEDVTNLLYPSLLLATSVLVVVGMGIYQRLSLRAENKTEPSSQYIGESS